MIPVEVSISLLQYETYDQWENLDLLKEKCDLAALRIDSYKRRFKRYFNSKFKERRLKEGDLVLQKVLPNTKEVNVGVLGSN